MAIDRRSALMLASLAVAALAFVNFHVWTTEIEIAPITPPPAAGGEAQFPPALGLTVASLKLQPLAAYRETTARALFNATRRPMPGAIETIATTPDRPAPSPEGFRVLGVVKEEAGPARALIVTPDAPHGTWLEEGQEVGGWRLAEIGEAAVTITSGGRRHRLALYATPAPAAGQKLNAVRPR